MKKEYQTPSLDVMEYAQFENVFTYCSKVKSDSDCVDVTGSGNDADKPSDRPPSTTSAFAGDASGA